MGNSRKLRIFAALPYGHDPHSAADLVEYMNSTGNIIEFLGDFRQFVRKNTQWNESRQYFEVDITLRNPRGKEKTIFLFICGES